MQQMHFEVFFLNVAVDDMTDCALGVFRTINGDEYLEHDFLLE
jgi:hypothetical protein